MPGFRSDGQRHYLSWLVVERLRRNAEFRRRLQEAETLPEKQAILEEREQLQREQRQKIRNSYGCLY